MYVGKVRRKSIQTNNVYEIWQVLLLFFFLISLEEKCQIMQGKSTKQKNLNAFMGVQKFSNFNRPKKEQYLVVTLIAMHGHYSQIVSIFIKYVLNNKF